MLETCVGCEKKYNSSEDGCGNLVDLTYCRNCFKDLKNELETQGEALEGNNDVQEFKTQEEVCNHLIAINQPGPDYRVTWKELEYSLSPKNALKSRTNLFVCFQLKLPMLYWF